MGIARINITEEHIRLAIKDKYDKLSEEDKLILDFEINNIFN